MKKTIIQFTVIILASLLLSSNVQQVQTKPIIEWVSIPAGTFTMGSPTDEAYRSNDEIQHQVTLSAFKMSKYEVTFEQYDAFCDATRRPKPRNYSRGRGRIPVFNVTWDDATAFAKWMGCRLPTEAEWEYACRAGTTTPFNTGIELTFEQANKIGPKPEQTRGAAIEVGSFPPNPWGLYDMHGNVWEYCSDWFGEYPTSAQTNPQGPKNGPFRVFRGGNWFYNENACRSAFRVGVGHEMARNLKADGSDTFSNGIRLVRSI